MNKRSAKQLKKAIPALIAALALANPGSVFADESAAVLQKDWTWTVQNQPQNIQTVPKDKESDERKEIFAPKPRIDAPVIQKTGDTCQDPGTTDGFYRCIKTFSNGFSVTISNEQEHHGDNFKRQTRIVEMDDKGQAQSSKTIRRKMAYSPFSNGKKLEKEFFDIVNRPKNKKITREVIIYEYLPETGNLKSMSWTSYEQIDETQFAMITRHIALNFDSNGSPLNGRAEKWKNQIPSERLFYWDRNMSGPLSVDSWKSWQEQIFNASPRQIF